MRVLLLLLTLTLALPGAAQAAGKLYKWTDEHGVTHYTDEPPAGTGYETRPVEVPPAPPSEPSIEAAVESENCKRVRSNVRTLEGGGEVRMDLDGDGEAELLDEPRRADQLEIARRQVGVYCTATEPAAADDPGAGQGG